MVKKYDIPIIISSDAHYPEHVGMYLNEAGKYAKSFGLDDIIIFYKRKREIEKIWNYFFSNNILLHYMNCIKII